MLARRKMRSRDLAAAVGITEQNISLLKSGKVKGIRFTTLSRICTVLNCTPGDILQLEE
ncbi:MAG: helix-turn-helix transcriptional regulator [Pseudomonadota bacterium]